MELVDCLGEAALVIIRSDHCGTKGREMTQIVLELVIEMRSVNIDVLVDLEQRATASAFCRSTCFHLTQFVEKKNAFICIFLLRLLMLNRHRYDCR